MGLRFGTTSSLRVTELIDWERKGPNDVWLQSLHFGLPDLCRFLSRRAADLGACPYPLRCDCVRGRGCTLTTPAWVLMPSMVIATASAT